MTARLRRGLASARWNRIVLLSAGLVAALAVLTWVQPPWAERLQGAWFDVFQVISPRQVATLPVTSPR